MRRRWQRVAHTTIGAGFGVAAVWNFVEFRPRADELLPWFADTAWLAPYAWVLDRLAPVAPVVVTAAAAFEATVAALLLTHRRVPLALGPGGRLDRRADPCCRLAALDRERGARTRAGGAGCPRCSDQQPDSAIGTAARVGLRA